MELTQNSRFGLLQKLLARVLEPPEKISTLEWFEKHLTMPNNKSLGGKITAWNTPVIAKLLDLLDAPSTEVIYIMGAARSGKSLSALAYIGRELTTTRRQILDCWPSDELIRRQIFGDFKDMVMNSPVFDDIIQDDHADRKAGNYKAKRYANGANLISANMQSSNDMSGVDAPVVIGHEIDRAPNTTGNDGAVTGQMLARQQASWNKIAIFESTPTIEGGAIHNGFESGTQHMAHFYFSCCQSYHKIVFFPERDAEVDEATGEIMSGQVVWDVDAEGGILHNTARYRCKCGAEHDDEKLKKIIYQRGEHELKLIAKYPDREITSVHAGWLLLTPFSSMKKIVKDYAGKLKAGPSALATFYNLVLGLPYSIPGTKIEASEMMARAIKHKDRYELVVPRGYVMVTAGVDVQAFYLAVQLVAWSEKEQKQVIYYNHIHGDTSTDEPWKKLFIFLEKEIPTDYSGNGVRVTLPIEAVCVDTGGVNTQAYYNQLRNKPSKYIPIKGSSRFDAPLFKKPRKQDINLADGTTIKEGISTVEIGVSRAKVYLYNQLSTAEKPGDDGYTHFHPKLGPDYFKELASEKLVVKSNKAGDKTIYAFETIQDRNEALDTFTYAYIAYVMTSGHMNEWFDYDERLAMLTAGQHLDGEVIEDAAHGNKPEDPVEQLKKERILCKILKNDSWMPSVQNFMNAGDTIDLSIDEYNAEMRRGVVAPLHSTSKILQVSAKLEEERLARQAAEDAVQANQQARQRPKDGNFLI